jgi:hypothetical protein
MNPAALGGRFREVFRGLVALFRYPLGGDGRFLFHQRPGLIFSFIVLGSIGTLRNLLEVAIGGAWANAWFALKPDIFFTMVMYPVFLAFFPAVLLWFFSTLFKIKVKMSDLFSLFFLMQILHLVIPFFDGLADRFRIPHGVHIPLQAYVAMLFSPVAFTPLILLVTRPTSLGIDIVWMFVAFILMKTYIRHYRFPLIRSLASLGLTFYLLYLSIYPAYLFFLNEGIFGSNYAFGLYFMFLSIPSCFFVVSVMRKEKKIQ